jgi:hypothetical protein
VLPVGLIGEGQIVINRHAVAGTVKTQARSYRVRGPAIPAKQLQRQQKFKKLAGVIRTHNPRKSDFCDCGGYESDDPRKPILSTNFIFSHPALRLQVDDLGSYSTASIATAASLPLILPIPALAAEQFETYQNDALVSQIRFLQGGKRLYSNCQTVGRSHCLSIQHLVKTKH